VLRLPHVQTCPAPKRFACLFSLISYFNLFFAKLYAWHYVVSNPVAQASACGFRPCKAETARLKFVTLNADLLLILVGY
jgi:hypothetical protein